MSGLSFPHGRRLTERAEFTRCYDKGRRFFSGNFVLFALMRDDSSLPWRLGMAVTRKTGSAVWRNRVRRLIREVFRQEQGKVPPGYDYVVVPKRSLIPRSMTLVTVRAELLPLFCALSARKAGAARAERMVDKG